jgi:hypothetical protein
MTLTPQPPTIIVQQGGSNVTTTVVLGAALLVMLVALVIVVLVLTSQNDGAPVPATAVADTTPAAQPTRSSEVIAQTLAAQTRPSFGRVAFNTAAQQGDSLSLSVRDLQAAPAGNVYVAWLQNTRTGETRKLGAVIVDAVGTGALTYTAEDGAFLPTLFNALLLTVEASAANAETPSATVAYHGLLPIELTDALTSIFIRSDLGLRGASLLETAKADARFTTQHAGLAARSRNVGAMRTHIEHTLNILLGGEQDFDGNTRASNPGTKIGLLNTLENLNLVLDAATSSPNATLTLQTEAELVRVCVENVRIWSEEIIAAEEAMLTLDSLEAAAPFMDTSTQFADILISGIDQNGNGTVDPFEGECGLDQIRQYGLVAATMDIYEGAPVIR